MFPYLYEQIRKEKLFYVLAKLYMIYSPEWEKGEEPRRKYVV